MPTKNFKIGVWRSQRLLQPPVIFIFIFNSYKSLSFIPSVHTLQNSDNNVLCSASEILLSIILQLFGKCACCDLSQMSRFASVRLKLLEGVKAWGSRIPLPCMRDIWCIITWFNLRMVCFKEIARETAICPYHHTQFYKRPKN
jgi:hypothetical protein